MKGEKIQTGLRIPQTRYDELKMIADRSGTSVNSLILNLIEIGLTVINRGAEATNLSELRNLQHTDE